MVEQEAVNFEVAGSSPAVGAIEKALDICVWGFFYYPCAIHNQQLADLSDDRLQFDNKEQDRKVYFYGYIDATSESSSRRN
jgi:hypothetical protein